MTLVGGIDVGNTTTEVVVAEAHPGAGPPVPVAWDRARTRGTKGSPAALAGGAALLRRLERRVGRGVDLVAVAPQRPVDTRTVTVAEAAPDTGRLRVVGVGGSTPGAEGTAVGRPVDLGDEPAASSGAVVLLVPPGTGYRRAADRVAAWLGAGADVRGVVVADDEGVLVAARLAVLLPVVDQVDVAALSGASLVALEVRPPGHPLRELADAVRLSALLALAPDERPDAVRLAAVLGDVSHAVVALDPARNVRAVDDGRPRVRMRRSGAVEPLDTVSLAGTDVGAVSALVLPGAAAGEAVDDIWAVALREVAASVAARVDPSTARATALATLRAAADVTAPDAFLAHELGVEVRLVPTETEAARAGALTTPGAGASALVVDVGGGTVDVMAQDAGHVVAAGAGEMLTVAVGAYLRLPLGAADWVKRGACGRLESPQVVLAEDGSRTFLERPAPGPATGSLVVPGPAGLLPFGSAMAPAEWRALRLRLKQRVLVDNLWRALRGRPVTGDVLVVGGAAGDDELLALLRPALGGAAVGRGDAAGRLGHRYAVAYGLALLATD